MRKILIVFLVVVNPLLTSCQKQNADRLFEENIALFRASLDQFINQHEPQAVDKYFDDRYVQHNEVVAKMAADRNISQKENTRRWFTYMMKAIPDLKVEIEHVTAYDDKVFAFLKWTGRHTGGEFLGVPPTNKLIEIRTAEIMKISNGKFIEHWDVTDQSKLYEALGFISSEKQNKTN